MARGRLARSRSPPSAFHRSDFSELELDARHGPVFPQSRDTRLSSGRRPRTSRPGMDRYKVCAISESRGISPTIGIAIVNLITCEAVLCQICDSQTYVRTCQKIAVFDPSEIIYIDAAPKTQLLQTILENLDFEGRIPLFKAWHRNNWSESSGHMYLQELAFPDDLESLRASAGGHYFAICCFAAVMDYIESGQPRQRIHPQSLRIRFEPSEGTMLIDGSTIGSLELIQNRSNAKSKHSLSGVMNETLTPMGSRFLRSNILQPSTNVEKLNERYEAVGELSGKENMFFGVRQVMKNMVDTDRVLAALVVETNVERYAIAETTQTINHVVMLKTFVDSIEPIWQALTGATSSVLVKIRELCGLENYEKIRNLISQTLNDDVTYSKQPLEMRNQRTYAVRAGLNGFLDVARQSYKEASEDAYSHVNALAEEHDLSLDMKYDPGRQFYIRVNRSEFEERELPADFINIVRNRDKMECQTLELVKLNQKVADGHDEVVLMTDKTIRELVDNMRAQIQPLFKISEAVALLDLIAGFAQLVTTRDYVRPELTETLAIKAGRHAIKERIQQEKFISNDVYATRQNRLQLVTGCNMSGKSTYIRSIALMAVMAHIGCYVPAQYASFPMIHHLCSRTASDDSSEANVSTFAEEMRGMASILRNVKRRSLIIVDELGRGTSTADGLAIAIAIAEALLESRAFVWFVTHFRELPRILQERSGVVNLHLAVDIADDAQRMKMLYKVANGYEENKFYGVALARVLDLPPDLLQQATEVSTAIHNLNDAKKADPHRRGIARRQKLILGLKEQLTQARDGKLEGEALWVWLKQLQDEFTVRMATIDADMEAARERDQAVDGAGRADRVDTAEETEGQEI